MKQRSTTLLFAVLFTIICTSFKSQAQDPLVRPKLYVEGFGGASKYFGEFTDISFWVAGGINAWYRLTPQFSVGGSVAIGQTRFRVVNDANLYYSGTPQVLARVTPIDLLGRWNVFPYETGTPYLTAGVGLVSFEVQSDIGEYIPLRKVNPETKTQEVLARNTSLTNVFQYNLGIGYEVMYSRNVTFGLFARMYMPSTDLLDGIQYEGSGNDAFLLTGFTGSFGVSSVTSMADIDEDGVPDQVEESLGTNPEKTDSDDDGLSDFDELKSHTNPLLKDTDNDDLTDRDEIELFKTNPLSTDTDGDGLRDNEEIAQNTDPLKPDTDGDSFSDAAEIMLGLNPVRPDAATPELLNATEEKMIGKYKVRLAKIKTGEMSSLKAELQQLQSELNHQKALLKVAENRPVQAAPSSSRSRNQVDVSAYQRRIDSLQYILAMAENQQATSTIRDTVFKDREIVREIPREIVKYDTVRITGAAKQITVRDTIFKDREVIREIPKEIVKEVFKTDTIFRDREVVREIPREVFKTDTIFTTKEVIREIPKEIVKEVIRRDTVRIAAASEKITVRDTVFTTKEIIREIPKEVVREVVKRDTVFETREIVRRDTVTVPGEALKIFIRDTIYRTSGDIADYPAGPPSLGGVRFTPSPIYFAPNSIELSADADATIAYVVAFMKEYPESIIEISGYADSVGTPEANKLVTQRRTGAVAQRLAQAGVDPTRLVERAYGNITATLQDPKERRVELKLLKLVRF